MESNVHHLYWEARHWRSLSLAKAIRDDPISKIKMNADIHRDLHHFVEPVLPPPTASMGRLVLNTIYNIPPYYKPLDGAKLLRDELEDTEASYLATHLDRQIPFLELSERALKARRV